MNKKVLITGGSGLIGSTLSTMLLQRGYEVAHLSRKREQKGAIQRYQWDYKKGIIEEEALKDCHAIIHLAGAGIADKRWTSSRKKEIINSRVQTAELLHSRCAEMDHWPKVFISASGINYYGSVTGAHTFREDDPPSESFIGECCRLWEEAARAFEPRCRVAMLRASIVLSAAGGALPKIALPVRFGLGAALGTGRQWMPYIHIDDLCKMYLHALEKKEVQGAYNACNGDHVNNRQFTKSIAKALGRPLILPAVPAFVLRLALGEMSEILLKGSRASAEKIAATGFEFEYTKLSTALEQLIGKR